MKVFELPRGGGKTTLLLDWVVKDGNRILVVLSEAEAMTLRHILHYKFRVEPSQAARMVYSVDAFKKLSGLSANIEIAIDNLDLVASSVLSGYEISVATVTA